MITSRSAPGERAVARRHRILRVVAVAATLGVMGCGKLPDLSFLKSLIPSSSAPSAPSTALPAQRVQTDTAGDPRLADTGSTAMSGQAAGPGQAADNVPGAPLSQTGGADVVLLENQARLFPGDRAIRSRLADAYAQAGRTADALALHRALRGDTPGPAGDVAFLQALRRSGRPGDAKLAEHLLVSWPNATRGILGDDDLELAARLAAERGALAEAAGWLEARARRRPQDAVLAAAWLAAVEDAGGDPTAALRFLWRLDSRRPEILEKMIATGVPALREEALRSYSGPRDGSVRSLLVRADAQRGAVDAAWAALVQLDTTSRAGLGDVAAILADSFLERGTLDRVRWLGDRFPLPAGVRARAARAALAAGRLDDAGHFGETGPRIALARLRRSGDTRAVAVLLEELWLSGSLDAQGLSELSMLSSSSGTRRLASLSATVRGTYPGRASSPAVAARWRDPRARILLGDARERAEAYLELGLPSRAADLLAAVGVGRGIGREGADPAVAVFVRALAASGRETEARAWLPSAISILPDAIDLRELAYRAAEAADDDGRRIAHLEAILAVDTRHAFARRTLPALYVRQAVSLFRDRPRALAILERALALDPASPVAHYNLALLHVMNGDSDHALSHVTEATRLAPRDVASQMLSASLYRSHGDRARAASAYRAAIDAGAPPSARQELALLLWQQGDSQTAVVAAGEAWKLEKENARFARTFGIFGARLGRVREVRDALEQAHREYPGDPEVTAAWAEALLVEGKAAEARQVMLAHPDRVLAASVTGRAWLRAGKPEAALLVLRPYRDRSSCRASYTAALAQLADLKLSERNLEAAQAAWREWLQFEPSATVPRALLAAAATPGSGPPNAAVASAAAVPAATVTSPVTAGGAIPSAARIATPTASVSSAGAAATRVPAAAPSSSATSSASAAPGTSARDMMRASAEALRTGDAARSATLAKQATEAAPRDPVAWNLLALAQSRQGRTSDAITAFERSLALKPEQDEVREALKELRSR